MNRRDFLRSSATAALVSAAVPHLAFAAPDGSEAHPIVATTAGRLRGVTVDGISHFLGIPYGADTRSRRFQPAVPPQPWTGVRDAVTYGPRAPQLGGTHGMMSSGRAKPNPDRYHLPPDEGTESEDCLHLNVWTPEPTPHNHAQRPVLVYIHGGAYNSGTVNSILYDGTHLAREGNAVVVTVNHRLNAFGYLYLAGITPDPAFADSGNVGMLDLVLALQWVHDNIAHFGGDPSRITIWGQSGGGAKCATLMAMPPAHGLFHRVMSMSGQQVTAAPPRIATEHARAFLAKLGLSNTPPDKLRDALEALPLSQLEAAATVSSAWLPVVDGRSLPRDPFSPDAPPISAHVPMILGNTHDETRGLIGGAHPELFSLTWNELPTALTKYIGAYLGPVTPETIVHDYRQWYPQYTPTDVFFAAATAFRSWPGQVIEAERRAANPTSQPHTWVYEMDWPSPVGGGRFRAPHTLDIPFYFDNLTYAPRMVGPNPDADAQALAKTMSQTLIAFGRTGNPNHPGLPNWPAYNLGNRPTMLWNTPPHVENNPRGRERELAAEAHYRQPGTF